jgi:hypothetical protein
MNPTTDQPTIKDLPDELQPCDHMVNLISRRSDDSLAGPAKWYTDFHVMTCPSCRVALKGLRELHRQVDDLASQPLVPPLKLSDENWRHIEEAIEK